MCTHLLHQFPIGLQMCAFNRQGTHLIGGRAKGPLAVVDIPSFIGDNCTTRQVRFSAKGYFVSGVGRNQFCFAGKDDDLVISASSADYKLYVWSLPEDQGNDIILVNQSLLELVLSVRYDHCNDLLASAGVDKTIKLWTRPLGSAVMHQYHICLFNYWFHLHPEEF